jgi:hypothetical protein
MGRPADPLHLYARHYSLTARCRRPGCNHTREIPADWLLRIFGGDASLGAVAERLRCHRCGMKGPRIEVQFTGPVGDGR